MFFFPPTKSLLNEFTFFYPGFDFFWPELILFERNILSEKTFGALKVVCCYIELVSLDSTEQFETRATSSPAR